MKSAALEWLALFGLLAGTYLATGLALRVLTQTGTMARRRLRERSHPTPPWRDIRRSLANLGLMAGLLLTGRYLQAAGFGFAPMALSPLSAVLTFAASLVLFDTWFYWSHRLLHTGWLFKHLHAEHHRTTHPTAWSTNNDAALDTLIAHLYWAIAIFLIPIHPGVLLFHKVYDQVTGTIGHCGHEMPGRVNGRWLPFLTVTHHDQHHERFRCNYATHFIFWDTLCGTLAPDYRARLDGIMEAAP